MTRIGLLSDTHAYLDKRVFEHFREVDEIWHAGDIGSMEVLQALREFRPTRAVFGNMDGGDVRYSLSEFYRFRVEGVQVLMTHIGGYPGHYNPWLLPMFRKSLDSLTQAENLHNIAGEKNAIEENSPTTITGENTPHAASQVSSNATESIQKVSSNAEEGVHKLSSNAVGGIYNKKKGETESVSDRPDTQAKDRIDLFVCGHSHILKVQYDSVYRFLTMNPGAAGLQGWQTVQTLLRFTIDGTSIKDLEVIELDRR